VSLAPEVITIRQHSQRQRRVAKLVLESVADIIQNQVQDPAIGFLTITDAEVSADLRNATVYYSVLGSEEQIEASTEALLRAKKFINIQLGDRLAMKYTPQLHFSYDHTAERAQRIEQALRSVQESTADGTEQTDNSTGDDELT
jgi:ribosome-binding factor A